MLQRTSRCVLIQMPVAMAWLCEAAPHGFHSAVSFSLNPLHLLPPFILAMQLARCQCLRFLGRPQRCTPWRFSASTSSPWSTCCGRRRYAAAALHLISHHHHDGYYRPQTSSSMGLPSHHSEQNPHCQLVTAP